MKKLIVANWKMNPTSETQAIRLARASDKKGIVIVPPFLFLEAVSHTLKHAKLGAQDLAWEDSKRGAFTGEISAEMLKDADVSYVILGHSECRRFSKETDAVINKKVRIALKKGFNVILCVGEPKRESGIRNQELGLRKARNYVRNQLKKDLKNVNNSKSLNHNSLIIAYEPVWAIGTGRNDTPKDASEMASFIKQSLVKNFKLKVKVLYGGSVTPKNVSDFLTPPLVDGVLIGGASTRLKDLKAVIKNVRNK